MAYTPQTWANGGPLALGATNLNYIEAGIQDAAADADTANTALALKAPLASPALTGTPTAPTAAGGTNTTQLATTAFVTSAVAAGGVVSSVFGRTGAVTATSGDYAVADVTGAAPLASPTFTGTPAAPTAAGGTNTTQIATTAFVTAAVAGAGSALTVKDEGSNLTTAATSLDFVGAGVTATNTGGAVTVTISGGGGGTFTAYDADAPVASPASQNDYFSSGPSLDGKWTVVNSQGGDTRDVDSTKPGAFFWHLANSSTWRAILQALPSGDFTIVADLCNPGVQNAFFGLCLSDVTTGNSGTLTVALSYTPIDWAKRGVYNYANWSSGSPSNIVGDQYVWNPRFYLRLRRSSTTYYLSASDDKRTWQKEQSFSLGYTPAYMGLAASAPYSAAVDVSSLAFEYANSATASFGNTRTITGS